MTTRGLFELGIYGALCGDAYGVPYEFKSAEELPNFDNITMNPTATLPDFRKTYPSVPFGTWSDDGAQMLCLLDTLASDNSSPECFEEDLLQSFKLWHDTGYMTPDGVVFDIGNQTRSVLGGETSPFNNSIGNGSLMRCLPITLWYHGDKTKIVEEAMRQSRVTHGNLVCQVGCALYCLWAECIIDGMTIEDAYRDAHGTLSAWFLAEGMMEHFDALTKADTGVPNGHGDVPNTLATVRKVLSLRLPGDIGTDIAIQAQAQEKYHGEPPRHMSCTPFEASIRNAISFGEDTDTTSCLVGGLAALYYKEISDSLMEALRGRHIAQQVIDRAIAAKNG